MRLIHARFLVLRSFDDGALPPYAILSHTWTAEEITMEGLEDAKSSDRCKRDQVRETLGYREIVKAC